MAKKKLQSGRQQRKAQKTNHARSHPQVSGANTEPIRSRLEKLWSSEETDASGAQDKDDQNRLAQPDSAIEDFRPQHPTPPLPPHPDLIVNLPSAIQGHFKSVLNLQDAATVTDQPDDAKDQETMNANGSHPPHRPQQPHFQRDRRNHVNDITPSLSTAPSGRMPNHIQVAKPYVFHQTIDGCLHELGVAQAREDNIRLAGVRWIDDVRKALKLPVRTFDTAVVYYHKFRLSHADNEYSFVDAAAAALFAACKIEDTLKKSRDILCAAHNLKVPSRADHLSSDDPIFEQQSRQIIGLERLMLEGSSFDFRNRHPQQLIVKLARRYGHERHSAITKTAYQISLDLYRTFAPLKQGTATMAFACLELAGRLHGQEQEAIVGGRDYPRWGIERAMVMETLLDLLELYTHYRPHTTVGPDFPLDAFLEIRIPLNDELSARRIPRHTEHLDHSDLGRRAEPAGYAMSVTNGIQPTPNGLLPNGRLKQSPTSPATPSTPATPGIRQKAGERGKEGTIRFMLNPDREREEKAITLQYAPLLASMKR